MLTARRATRMARAPEQCIRYRFDAEARPLWPSRENRAPRHIPPCPRCGAARQFEFQVLPQALHFMGVDSSQAEAPDWSTIAVYTCSASCAPRARRWAEHARLGECNADGLGIGGAGLSEAVLTDAKPTKEMAAGQHLDTSLAVCTWSRRHRQARPLHGPPCARAACMRRCSGRARMGA